MNRCVRLGKLSNQHSRSTKRSWLTAWRGTSATLGRQGVCQGRAVAVAYAEVVQLATPGQVQMQLAKMLMVSSWDPGTRRWLQVPPADTIHLGPPIP